MKVLLICTVLGVVTLTGCGSELANIAGGAAGGIGIKNTLEGMQADLAQREQALIARYNELVEAGAKAETLEDLKQEIADTVRLRQTTGVVEQVAGTKWNDPAAAGASVAAILAVAYGWLKKRDLTNTVAGVRAFRAQADETTKHSLDKVLLDKKATT